MLQDLGEKDILKYKTILNQLPTEKTAFLVAFQGAMIGQ